ncbi:META domain-containing protein [Limibaculum sp. M0105]|uniref:META domain-containing protein n=1 Tax=Thermohalobaculum xanthum TaxID=2753746 RepID=A0A8J7SFF4_9RHOB|nr:META domain-containing protein [Thermohalobaculum xanthum]MBK0400363.1 META domain-containing protein [Thermohalobaculum xanthum]
MRLSARRPGHGDRRCHLMPEGEAWWPGWAAWRGVHRLLAAASVVLLSALPGLAGTSEIAGTVNWTDGTRVPPGALVTVKLLDVGQPEGAVELASIVLKPGDEAPLGFRLLYDEALIAPRGSYRLTARMAVGKLALMESLRSTPVLTVGGTADPEILLERIRIAAGAPERSPVGREWVVASILDEPVTGAVRVTMMLGDNGTAQGSSGCNTFTASYELSPEVLDLGSIKLTKRGCSTPIMRIERGFLKALRDVRGWRINDQQLLLLDAAGTVMMRLDEGR